MRKYTITCVFSWTLLLMFGLTSSYAQTKTNAVKDSTQFTSYKGMPLKATRAIAMKTSEGTWTSLAISPDGKTILFDLMGDIYSMPVEGGKATAITKGMAYDNHPSLSLIHI
jgi:Tol biopolymer transport system component